MKPECVGKSRTDRDDLAETLAAETHHRVANSLGLASAMLGMQARQSDDPTVQRALGEAQGRLAAIASVHSVLQKTGSCESVVLSDFLHELLPAITESIGARYELDLDGAEIRVSGRMASHLGIVVNELSLNALKHAYAGQPEGRVSVTLKRQDDRARLEIRDGGAGLAEGFDAAGQGGLGLSIVRSLVESFGGTLAVRNADGACFTIAFAPD